MSLLDMIAIGGLVTVITVVLLFAFTMSSIVGNQLNATFTSMGATPAQLNTTAKIFVGGNKGLSTLDYMIIVIFVFLALSAIILAFMLPTHPVFIIVFLVVQVIIIWIASQFSHLFTAISGDPLLAPFVANVPQSVSLMQNLPLLSFIISVIIAIVMYAKSGMGGGPQFQR